MILLLLIVIILILVFFHHRDTHSFNRKLCPNTSSTDKIGEYGERRVALMLKSFAQNGYIINDVIVRWHNLYAQIDHILFLESGIYVIETKNLSGRIYGKDREKYWTQVLAYGKEKHHIYSPVLQNNTHINILRHILGENNLFFSVVIFVNANIDYIQSNYVYTVKGAKNSIKYRNGICEYSKEEILDMYNKINYFKENPPISEDEYVEMVKMRHN